MRDMSYIIIHPNQKSLDECVVKTINKYFSKKFNSLEQALHNPDFFVVEKEEKGNIKIEQVKELQKRLYFSPYENSHQFALIKEAHLMTTEAQNALLKTLEECCEKTIIVLTTNSESAVLQTILSRCTRIYPKSIDEEIKNSNQTKTQAFLNKPIYEQIDYIDKIVKEKKTEAFMDKLISFFRERHLQKIKNCEDAQEEVEIIKTIVQAKQRIKRNLNTKIALEYILFKINHLKDKHKKF